MMNEQIEGTERLLLISQGELARNDRKAFQIIQGAGQPDEDMDLLLKAVVALRPEAAFKYPRLLDSAGLIALQILVSGALFAFTGIVSFLISRTKALHYLGLTDQAIAEIQASGLAERDRSAAMQLLEFYCDTFRFSDAEALAAAAERRTSKFSANMRSRLRDHQARLHAARAMTRRGERTARVYVVNLARDRYRRWAVDHRLKQLETPYTLVSAISSDDVPKNLKHLLQQDAAVSPDGSYGNQLTQYRIWNMIADGKKAFGIVLEDDAFVTVAGLESLDYDRLVGERDIVFFNDRLALQAFGKASSQLECRPLADVLVELSMTHPETRAFGSDGYLLSKSGAAKLIEIAHGEGFHSIGTDWYLISHAVAGPEHSRLNEPSVLRARLAVAEREKIPGLPTLSGGVISPALVEHRPLGVWRSTRA